MKPSLDDWISCLRAEGAREVDQYEAKLHSHSSDSPKVEELISEARVALTFLRHAWQVTMRDKPDLMLEFASEILYAEGKHFHMKETDRCGEAAMAAAGDDDQFVPIGRVKDYEGSEAWKQMYCIAVKKVPQYLEGVPNILVFVSYSDSLDLTLQSAINEYGDEAARPGADPARRKLSGMMMLNPNYGPSTEWTNVETILTANSAAPLSQSLAIAIGAISQG